MNRMFLAYVLDVTWRSTAWLVVAFILVLPTVLAWGLDRDMAIMFALAVGGIAAFMYANRFGANLSWLQLAPISRSRLWWYSYVANILPFSLVILFLIPLYYVARYLPAAPVIASNGSSALPSSHVDFVPFGESHWPYLLTLITLAHAMMILPRTAIRAHKKSRGQYLVAAVYLTAFFLLPQVRPSQMLLFAVLMGAIAWTFTDLSARFLGLPRDSRRRFQFRYGAMTLVLTGFGLFAIW